jgi:hypothetical protein
MLRAIAGPLVAYLLTGCGGSVSPGHRQTSPPVDADASSTDANADASSQLDASGDASVVALNVPTVCTDAGSSAAPGACEPKFASGVNVAWVNYGADVPNPNLSVFDQIFSNVYQSGGRVIRWWFHTDGHVTPGYGADGKSLPATCSQIADVRSILDHAAQAKVMVLISLWNFTMLNGTLNPTLLANNTQLLTDDASRQAYIDNYLAPLAAAIAGHPGLYGWEVFDEPEGMSDVAHFTAHSLDGGAGPVIAESYVQKSINWFADAIHAADPHALVTNGTWTIKATTDPNSPLVNYYSDPALFDAGGRVAGFLDFYEAHYYPSDGTSNSPYLNAASTYGLDKPLVIGEFDALDTDNVSAANLYTTIHSNGYAGALAWKYLQRDSLQGDNSWPSMQVPMQNLYSAAPTDVDCP